MKNKTKKVFVTGATGYVGRNLVFSLAKENYLIYILTRKETSLFKNLNNVHTILGNINEPINLPEGVSTIFHCAGIIHNKKEIKKVNIQGTKNIVDLALKNNCKLIHLSSAGIVGKTNKEIVNEETLCSPRNHYEKSKYEAEKIVLSSIKKGLKAQILRPTTIFGIGQNPEKDTFLKLVKSMRTSLYKNIGNGILNIVHIDEVVKAMRILDQTNADFGNTYIISNHIFYGDLDLLVKNIEPEVQKKTMKIPYIIAFVTTIILTALYSLVNKKSPLTFQRLRALTDKRIYSQKNIIKNIEFKNNYSIKKYIGETCTEYIKLGLMP